MNEIINYTPQTDILSSESLTEEQLSVIPLVAAGVSVTKIAERTKIPKNRIVMWMKTDAAFRQSVIYIQEENDQYVQKALADVSILALENVKEILLSDSLDRTDRRIKADIIKTLLTGAMTKKSKISIELPESMSNIDENSKAIVDQYTGKAQTYVVIDDVKIDNETVIMHKDTEYGIVNFANNKFQCHMCGKWFLDIVVHIREHGLNPAKYRELYKIPDSVELYRKEPLEVEEVLDDNIGMDSK